MSQLLPPRSQPSRSTAALLAPIEADLAEVERVLERALASRRTHVARLVQHVGLYRGKRLRPMLLLLTARACGQLTPDHHILGAVVEMIHAATLVHDDILDDASMRRHVETVNARWGTQDGVLLGDYLFTQAFYLASTTGDARACRLIGEATNRVCEGELQQVGERGNLKLTEDEYFDIINGKTAELTACCCQLGAMFAGATDEVVEALTRYGRNLGLAFQIADDLLDLIGEERSTGKSLGTDLEQRKLTLPLIRLLEGVNGEHGPRVRQILDSPGNHKREALAPYLAKSDALDYARRRAEAFAEQARNELECLAPSACRSILEAVTERVVHRDS